MKKIFLLTIFLSSILIFSGCEKTQPTITATAVEESGNQNTIIVSDSGNQQRITTLEQEIAELKKRNEQYMNNYYDLQTNISNCNAMIADAKSHSEGAASEMKEALESLHACYEEYDREYEGE